jgi:hypothetical protein
MLAFPGMLIEAAKQAGMKIPPDADDFDANEYPHFQVFCLTQLGRYMRPGEHWTNAEVIARIPANKIKTTTMGNLIDQGLAWAT